MDPKIFLYILVFLTLMLLVLNIKSRKSKNKNKRPIISEKIAQAMASKIKFESEQHRKKK